MAISKVKSKGQTTIPLEIRSYLGLHEGDRLKFLIDDEGKVIVIPFTIDVTNLKGLLPKPKKKVSIEDMNRVIGKRGRLY